MARISGVDLPREKRVEIGLTQIIKKNTPIRLFVRVDLPTFGRPTIATKPA